MPPPRRDHGPDPIAGSRDRALLEEVIARYPTGGKAKATLRDFVKFVEWDYGVPPSQALPQHIRAYRERIARRKDINEDTKKSYDKQIRRLYRILYDQNHVSRDAARAAGLDHVALNEERRFLEGVLAKYPSDKWAKAAIRGWTKFCDNHGIKPSEATAADLATFKGAISDGNRSHFGRYIRDLYEAMWKDENTEISVATAVEAGLDPVEVSRDRAVLEDQRERYRGHYVEPAVNSIARHFGELNKAPSDATPADLAALKETWSHVTPFTRDGYERHLRYTYTELYRMGKVSPEVAEAAGADTSQPPDPGDGPADPDGPGEPGPTGGAPGGPPPSGPGDPDVLQPEDQPPPLPGADPERTAGAPAEPDDTSPTSPPEPEGAAPTPLREPERSQVLVPSALHTDMSAQAGALPRPEQLEEPAPTDPPAAPGPPRPHEEPAPLKPEPPDPVPPPPPPPPPGGGFGL